MIRTVDDYTLRFNILTYPFNYFIKVLRIMPRMNEEINEEWLDDKSRFACDGLKRQRLTVPMIKDNQGIHAYENIETTM